MRLAYGILGLGMAATAAAAAGCSAVADLDRFEKASGCSLELTLRDFKEFHGDDLFVLRVVSPLEENFGPDGGNAGGVDAGVSDAGADGGAPSDARGVAALTGSTAPSLKRARLRAVAIVDPFAVNDAVLRLPNVADDGLHHADFFADRETNRRYDDPDDDHTWREEDICSGPIDFPHQFGFSQLPRPEPAGNDFCVQVRNLAPASHRAFEVRVEHLIEASGAQGETRGRTVGLYRDNGVDEEDFAVRIPGIIEPATSYRISWWVDRADSSSRNYDGAPDDLSARFQKLSANVVRCDADEPFRIDVDQVDAPTDIGSELFEIRNP